MGVPALFRWLSSKYPKIVSPVIEEQPVEVDGVKIPLDTSGPNPNGEEMDNLYLDMNGIVHPCSHPEDRPPPENEQEMMMAVFEYTDRVVRMARPRKILMIAVDGVAPRAKMNQQRSRRFRSAQEAKQKDEEKAEFQELLRKSGRAPESVDEVIKKTWDSNAITPGTPFMHLLALSLRYWCSYKLNTDPAWEKLKIIISDASVPGEGEHKIMNFIRSQRRSPTHDPNTRHVIYGLDADLIMLGLATHEPHFRVLREDVFLQSQKGGDKGGKTCNTCGQLGHFAAECRGVAKTKQGEHDEKQGEAEQKPFIWLHVSILREYLSHEMHVPNQSFPRDLERELDDWVFMCFFVGNDFLPHLPSLEIREEGIDTLIKIWRELVPQMDGYVTKDGVVNMKRAQMVLEALGRLEDGIFQRRREIEERRAEKARQRKRAREEDDATRPTYKRVKEDASTYANVPFFDPKQAQSNEVRQMNHDIFINRKALFQAEQTNKSAAAALKDRLLKRNLETVGSTTSDNDTPASSEIETQNGSSRRSPDYGVGGSKRKADAVDESDSGTPGRATPITTTDPPKAKEGEMPPDTVKLWEEGYADRYYEQKFKVDPKDIEFRHKVARSYAEGLCWVMLYYFQGCPSWTWYYPYHYAPFAADFKGLADMKIDFSKGKPSKPYEQLMSVLPAASNHAIPESFRSLMTDEESPILDFYPEDFELDLNGKKFAWQGVALLPFIDQKRLLEAMATKSDLLTSDEKARNEMGHETLLFSAKHPLYDTVTSSFYSKKAVASVDLDTSVSEGLAGKIEKNEDYIPQDTLTFPLEPKTMPDLEDDQSVSVYYEMHPSAHLHKSQLLRGVDLPKPVLNAHEVWKVKNPKDYRDRNQNGRGGRGGGRGGYNNNGPRHSYSDGQLNNSYNLRSGNQPPGFPPGPGQYGAPPPGGPIHWQPGMPVPPPPPGWVPGMQLPAPPANFQAQNGNGGYGYGGGRGGRGGGGYNGRGNNYRGGYGGNRGGGRY